VTLLEALAPSPEQRAAAYPLDASSLEVRTPLGPVGFHELLRDLFQNAKQRISIASLYYGTGKLEAELLGDIDGALRRSADLRVRLLFDHSRGNRRTKTGSSSSFVSQHLLTEKNGERVELFLHRLPQLAGIARMLPSPLNELLAVCHFKVMVVDDLAVLTGANLSDEYFYCRHARVIVVRDQGFADMLDGIVRIASEHSRRVRDGREHEPARAPAEVGARVVAHVAEAASHAKPGGAVMALPLFQHPRVGLAQERALLNRMFARSEGELFIHTPYTNMQADYLASLAARLASRAQRTSLLLASRFSHSFTTGRGFKALVPGFYAEREHHMHTQLRLLSKGGAPIEMSYYHRPDWVFHSKGVWLRTDDETATIIGSSSFGARSVARDFDLSVLLVTKDARLREAFAGELTTTAPFVRAGEPGTAPERPLSSLVTSPIVRSYM
jgi:CDP-diacylglycerol--glycerol-3-phosphate 3-phosphatidyltransferase